MLKQILCGFDNEMEKIAVSSDLIERAALSSAGTVSKAYDRVLGVARRANERLRKAKGGNKWNRTAANELKAHAANSSQYKKLLANVGSGTPMEKLALAAEVVKPKQMWKALTTASNVFKKPVHAVNYKSALNPSTAANTVARPDRGFGKVVQTGLKEG